MPSALDFIVPFDSQISLAKLQLYFNFIAEPQEADFYPPCSCSVNSYHVSHIRYGSQLCQPFYSLASLKLCSHSTSPFTYRHSILLHAREAYPRRHVRHSRHVTLTKSIFPLSLPILLTLRYIYVNTSLSFSFSLSHTRTLIKHTNASIGKRTRIGMKK